MAYVLFALFFVRPSIYIAILPGTEVWPRMLGLFSRMYYAVCVFVLLTCNFMRRYSGPNHCAVVACVTKSHCAQVLAGACVCVFK